MCNASAALALDLHVDLDASLSADGALEGGAAVYRDGDGLEIVSGPSRSQPTRSTPKCRIGAAPAGLGAPNMEERGPSVPCDANDPVRRDELGPLGCPAWFMLGALGRALFSEPGELSALYTSQANPVATRLR